VTTPDYPDWNVPQATAAAIATGNPAGTPGGVPLLSAADVALSATLANIAIGGNASTGPIPIAQTGYACYLTVQNHTSTTQISGVKIQFDWTDAESGLNVLTESWVVAAGPAGTPHVLKGRGPSAASQLTVTAFDASISSDAVDVGIDIVEDSRIYTRSDLRTYTLAGAGFTLPTSGMDQDILMSASPAGLASGGSWTRLLPLYTGTVNVLAIAGSGTSDAEIQVQGVIEAFGLGAQAVLADLFSDSHGNLNAQVGLPRFQCVITALNHNAGNKTIVGTCTVVEQET
jgi:hypothetical protein